MPIKGLATGAKAALMRRIASGFVPVERVDAMTSHAHYFARRERQCCTLAEIHTHPVLRRVYEEFADNYARALKDDDSNQASPRIGAKGLQHVASVSRASRTTS